MPRKSHAVVALVVFVVCAAFVSAYPAKALTNKDVVTMVKGGLASQTIVEIIRQSECNFDISPEAMVALKQDGVPDVVIQAMVAKNNPSGAPESQPLSSGNELSEGRGVTFIDGSARVQM